MPYMASAHLIITIAFNILKTGKPYQELRPNYVQQHHKSKELKMIEYLKKKGYSVSSLDEQTAYKR